ncbi:hypothetical protein [Marinisporobacter balticus]|nr:hypothetical protein [Marinisporobacter balticus]
MVQLPLPKHIDDKKVLERISYEKERYDFKGR